MKKLFSIFTFIFLLLFASACNQKSTPSNTSNKDISIKENTANDNELGSEAIKADSDFSSKYLIYFIMTDRFYDSDTSNDKFSDVNKNNPRAYHGGDLGGVIDMLDYIKSLGTTAI